MAANTPNQPQIGVINPYALAQLRLGRPINWSRVNDSRKLLETILGKPYEQLFDPKFDSPLYAGLKYDPTQRTMVRDTADPVLTAPTLEQSLNSLLQRTSAPATGKPAAPPATSSMRTAPHQRRAPDHGTGARFLAPTSDADRPAVGSAPPTQVLDAPPSADLPPQLTIDPTLLDLLGPSSLSINWIDPGHFFEDAARPIDVIQGALGDCYFVAALASVAWAHPFAIAQRTRATDAIGLFGTPGAVDEILFWDGSQWQQTEVTELLPMQAPANSYIYARADDLTETWPAIYEKAYAKWRTGNTSDQPNYALIAGGDPVGAAAQLTGLPATYYGTANQAAHDIWQIVRANSLSCKTFNPMVAWTYPSGDASPDKINYADATIVANHAYSILGWDYANNQEYIVLRNPWGNTEATLNVETGTWYAYDGSFWRAVSLPGQGIFALRADTFKQYFAGLGVVSGTVMIPEF